MIAIIDDDPDMASALWAWLDLYGLKASLHPSGESLLRSLELERGVLMVRSSMHGTAPRSFQLKGVVIDFNLPGMSGHETARTLRELAPTLPLVLVSAMSIQVVGDAQARGEPIPFLRKPFDLTALEAAFHSVLSSSGAY